MNKPIPFSARIPENIQTRIAEIADLLGYSQNQVAVEILGMGLNMIYSPDYGGFPRIVTIGRAVLFEKRTQKVSEMKSPLGNGTALTLDALPSLLKAKLQRTSLNGGQMRALRHLAYSERITRREYEAVTQTPASTAKRQLAGLVKLDILVKRGKSRNSWYELVNEEKDLGPTKITSRKRTALSRNEP